MKKKIILGIAAAGTALALLPMFAAFEAHVINVTAQIENALAVTATALDFGTVFPQEHLEKNLRVALSSSFLTEDRVDDVEYFIRQKPKCGVTSSDGTVLVGPTWTGHVVVVGIGDTQGYTSYIDCEQDRPGNVTPHSDDLDFYLLPSLCEYISKEADTDVVNDETTFSFHQPFAIATTTDNPFTPGPDIPPLTPGTLVWNDTNGRLSKADLDEEDNWIIDLSVPCFGNFCAQDWATFVDENDGPELEGPADPDDYVQPIENEHKIFGCNLWVEVTEVSETPRDVRISNSTDGGGINPDPVVFNPLPNTVVASTTYTYIVDTVSSSGSSIPTVQWKVTIDGPSVLSVGMVHVDEVGWQDPDELSGNIFHYKMSVVGGNLVAIGSCTTADDHSDACTVDDFDADPNDNFKNVDSIHFDASAPSGVYVIKRQLVNTGDGSPLSNELIVDTVTK